MARRLYGGSTADFTFDGDKTVSGVRLAVSTAATSLSRVTTGLEAFTGGTITAVTSDSVGEIRFYGTDLPSDLYVAALAPDNTIPGPWYVLHAQDLGALLDQTIAVNEAQSASIATLQAQISALQGSAQPPLTANPTGVALTFDETTRRPTVTWTLPTTGKVRLSLTGSTGVTATTVDTQSAAQSYVFAQALPAGAGYFQVVVTSLDASGQPIGTAANGNIVTVRTAPKVGVTLTTPTASGRVISTIVKTTGGDGTALPVGVRAQTLNGAGTVLSSVDLPTVQATAAGVTASWTVPDSTTATIVRFTATAVGVSAVMTPSVTVASNLATVDPVTGVDGYFTASTRTATVVWASPLAGSVTVTRADNLGNTATTTVGASPGTYSFPVAIAQSATSLQMTVTGSDGSTGSKTIDVTAPAAIPADAATAPSTAFATTGTWQSGSASEIYTSTASSAATLDFTGTYFQLTVVTDSHHGSLTLKIDTGANVTINEKTTTRNETAVVYTATTLTSGSHKATLTAVGDGVVTIVSAKVASFSGAPNPTTPAPGTTTPASGFITKDPNAARLILGGQTYKFMGFNGVNFFGATNAQRQITDYEAYYRDTSPGETTRLWFQPGMGTNYTQLDAALTAAAKYNAKIIIALFDALGTYGPDWNTMKSQWSTYSQHVTRVVTRYRNNTTVAFWEIANEPPFDRAGFDLVGSAIKAIDSNHLVATGTNSCWSDADVPGFQNACASQYVDIISMHEYDTFSAPSPHLARHVRVAQALKKPLMVGEFGIDANADGSGVGNTGQKGAMTFAQRASMIQKKADAYCGTAEVCGANYWSIGKNNLDGSADSYMSLSETLGINGMKAAVAKWTKNSIPT